MGVAMSSYKSRLAEDQGVLHHAGRGADPQPRHALLAHDVPHHVGAAAVRIALGLQPRLRHRRAQRQACPSGTHLAADALQHFNCKESQQ